MFPAKKLYGFCRMPLIECVPNFSEGRNLAVINEIVRAAVTVDGAYVLHKDIGSAVNRTVMTMAGEPAAVIEAAFNVIDYAARLIDMRQHSGEHPRIGATDVCPIIPLAGITMAECVELSLQLAKRIGSELKIPVYLYGESAQLTQRKDLAYLRKGQYENLALRIEHSEYKPDFGPTEFNAKSGATVIGAEPLYIAYNLNLNTRELSVAKSIAQAIRRLRQVEPKNLDWQSCQAIGWFIEEYDCCQISMNLLNYRQTPLFDIYQAVSKLAMEHNTQVTGSEIIGLAPLSALLKAGKSVLSQVGLTDKADIDEKEVVNAAIKFLNLSQYKPFIAAEKVLEYKLAELGLSLK